MLNKIFKGNMEDRIIKTLCILFFLLLFVLGVIAVAIGDVEFIYDRFISSLSILLLLLVYKRLNFRLWSVALLLLVIILHHVKLYGEVYFGFLEFDMIMHFVAPLVFAFLAYQYLYHGKKLSKAESAVIACLIAFGFSALNEVIEYVGYYFLGPGEGLLFYGVGDFGEYADTSWDLIMNLSGAILGSVLMAIFSKRKRN